MTQTEAPWVALGSCGAPAAPAPRRSPVLHVTATWSALRNAVSASSKTQSETGGFGSFLKCFGSSVRGFEVSENEKRRASAFFTSLCFLSHSGKAKITIEIIRMRSHNMLVPTGAWGQGVVLEVCDASPSPGRAQSDEQAVGDPGGVRAAQTEPELLCAAVGQHGRTGASRQDNVETPRRALAWAKVDPSYLFFGMQRLFVAGGLCRVLPAAPGDACGRKG